MRTVQFTLRQSPAAHGLSAHRLAWAARGKPVRIGPDGDLPIGGE